MNPDHVLGRWSIPVHVTSAINEDGQPITVLAAPDREALHASLAPLDRRDLIMRAVLAATEGAEDQHRVAGDIADAVQAALYPPDALAHNVIRES